MVRSVIPLTSICCIPLFFNPPIYDEVSDIKFYLTKQIQSKSQVCDAQEGALTDLQRPGNAEYKTLSIKHCTGNG